MNLWRSSSLHPGWPLPAGPLRVPGGVVRLRPVRLRDGAQWSRIRLADRAHLEPWEPAERRGLGSAACDYVVAIGVFRPAVGGAQRPDAAVCDRGRRAVRRPADDRQRDARRAAVGVDRVLGGDARRPGVGSRRPRWRWVWTTASAQSRCTASRRQYVRRTPPAARCWQRSAFAKRGCYGAISRWTARGVTTCWSPSPSRSSTARRRPRWCGTATRAGRSEPSGLSRVLHEGCASRLEFKGSMQRWVDLRVVR